jgi:hypothetical protein
MLQPIVLVTYVIGDQLHVYGGVPPIGFPLIVTEDPAQITDGGGIIPAVIMVGCVITQVCVAVPVFASVTNTVYVPAAKPVAICTLPPEGAHENV